MHLAKSRFWQNLKVQSLIMNVSNWEMIFHDLVLFSMYKSMHQLTCVGVHISKAQEHGNKASLVGKELTCGKMHSECECSGSNFSVCSTCRVC